MIPAMIPVAKYIHLLCIKRKQQDVLQVVIVLLNSHRGEGDHRTESSFQAIGETMDGVKRGIAGFDQFITLVRRKVTG